MEKVKFLPKNKISQLPKTSGVYLFKEDNDLTYIGKARNIQERVKNHSLDLVEKIGYIKTDSEIEALILEANLIRKYRPKRNVVWKDDKNYFYVGRTQEDFPEVFITHQPKNKEGWVSFIGPFVDGGALKETLKVLGKVFPYRSCTRIPKKPCLWYHLRRCPAPCLVDQRIRGFRDKMKSECRRNVRNLMATLKYGKTRSLKTLKDEMAVLAQEQQFEQAAKIRNQIASLEKVMSNAQILDSGELSKVRPYSFGRAEAYDVANIQGKMATGAMVVFSDGAPDKSQYRQFRIKIGETPNDIAMLKEILSRRLKHKEWPYPDLILIDGGKAQLNIAISTTKNYKLKTKIMALAKRENELYIEGEKTPVLLKNLPRETFNLILQLRDEAHRFAQRYHHKLRQKALLG